MRKFFDIETRETITEMELESEFAELKKADPETYDYNFSEYITNCTGKNGTLVNITDSYLRNEIYIIIADMIDNGEIYFNDESMVHTFIDVCMDEIESKFETYGDYRATDLKSVVLEMIDVYKALGIIV